MKEENLREKATYPPGYILEKQENSSGSDSQKIFLNESGTVAADMEATSISSREIRKISMVNSCQLPNPELVI